MEVAASVPALNAGPERHIGRSLELEEAPLEHFAGMEHEAIEDNVVFFPGEDYDEQDEENQPLEHFNLRVIFNPKRNVLEESVNFRIEADSIIAGSYRIVDYLGSGVFSRAVQCVEMATGRMVCIKIIRNNKDFFDQARARQQSRRDQAAAAAQRGGSERRAQRAADV